MYFQKGSTLIEPESVVREALCLAAASLTLGSCNWPAACATSSQDTEAGLVGCRDTCAQSRQEVAASGGCVA